MKRPLRICFVTPLGYPVLAGDSSVPVVGGSETQQAFIAPELARRGYDVSMISMDFGQCEGNRANGVSLLKMHSPNAGLPVLRFIHPGFTSLWNAMRRADADVYYQQNAGATTAFVIRFALSHARRALFAGASDFDFDPALPFIRFARDKALFRYGVRNAHQVVVQSERQQQMCRKTFGRESVVINSCYGHEGSPGRHDGTIIWVGRIVPIKRAELFLDLAERLPQYRFRIVGGAAAGAAHFDALKQRAASLGNVEMTGFAPFDKLESNFDGASLLVNTSVSEGFPNTFMQAWSRGIPTVSFFDAGARVDGVDVGTTVSDLDAMQRAVLTLKTDPVLWHENGARAVGHFRRNYTVASTVDAYEHIFEKLKLLPKETCT